MHRAFALWVAAGLSTTLGACRQVPPPEAVARADVQVVEEPRWRAVASAEDAGRLDRVGQAWATALAEARGAGFTRAIAREDELLEPGAALAMPAPTPGSYRCRLIRFAPPGARGTVFTVHRPFFCYVGVDGDSLSIIKQTGTERPSGYLWTDNQPNRLIFLGSMADEPRSELVPYGADRQRDMAGIFERVADYRFRLVVPSPRSGALLDVYELVPNVEANRGQAAR